MGEIMFRGNIAILYAATGQARFKRMGLRILTWTLAAAFVFFGVLIFDNLR